MTASGPGPDDQDDLGLAEVHRKLDTILADLDTVRRLALSGRAKYDLDRAADRLGVSRRTVERRIEQGELASVREGGRRYVTESALRDYEDRARRGP